jgi:hypothetical protein
MGPYRRGRSLAAVGRIVSERNPKGGPNLTWLSHGPDAPLSSRGRVIFYSALLAIVAFGLVLVAISR